MYNSTIITFNGYNTRGYFILDGFNIVNSIKISRIFERFIYIKKMFVREIDNGLL